MKLKDYFFASETNDYKPWILTPTALVVFCLVIWALRLFVPETITIAAAGIDPTDLMNRINNERTQRFIPALITNDKLITAATGKAQDMLNRSYFAHVDPDGNYVWPRIEAAGYKPYQTLGENLAMDFDSAQSEVVAWMNSPTHRANILNQNFEDQGLANIYGQYEPEHNTNMTVSLFGTLYKPTTNPPPAPQPTPQPSPTPIPKPVPASVPNSIPARQPVNSGTSLQISPDVKITTTMLSGQVLINVDAVVAGNPTLVTARLKTQAITLLPAKDQGEFSGSFTFNTTEDLTDQKINIEARDKNGAKINTDFPVSIASAETQQGVVATAASPINSENQVILILRIIFGVFAAIYMIFLVVDAIIIHRTKIKRPGINPHPHIFILFLIAAISLFAGLFK
jgi:hypothetical protein